MKTTGGWTMPKRFLLLLGVLLIVLGAVALAYQSFSYTSREKVAEIGPFKATVEHEKTLSVPPILGGVLVAAGVVLVVVGARSR
jgi:uncharacterized membrane protein